MKTWILNYSWKISGLLIKDLQIQSDYFFFGMPSKESKIKKVFIFNHP